MIPEKLFRDSTWNVMLELHIGAFSGQDVYVKQAIIASGECPATAMLIIARLDATGLLVRKGDPLDQRRVLVSLTDAGREAMELLLQQLAGGCWGKSGRRFALPCRHPPWSLLVWLKG